jgi:dienelactone hydrolase
VGLELSDPSEPGNFPVKSLQYGSGADRHRREFAEGVDWVTEPVDGSAFIEGWDKRSGWARTQYWGFDAERLPLQGRVWYPDGEGPFPLVLVVHGNHSMEDFSDPGYGYLGELFASRGIILVSVDENFINSSFSGRLNGLRGRGLKEENDARGWILLEHLRQWSEWNADPSNPFYESIDLGRIGLIGHSRGGEAVAVAAAFSQLPFYPDDATVKFDYDFSIRAVAAIAPVDGQYKPAGLGTAFADVDYFVLHGSHDGDVQSFAGSRQFERVRFSSESFGFKSSLYIYGANHGQFNTTWGRTDSSFPHKNFLNLDIIMPPEDQARIAKVYLSAFFETALRDETGYLPLFRDFRRGARWLPDTIYLTHYEDSTHRVVSNFEEDRNVVTTTFPGGSQSGENLTVWKEQLVELKHRDKATNAVYLGWNQDAIEETASFTIHLPAEGISATETDTLVFTLADAKEKSDPKKLISEKSDEDEKEEKEPVPIDLNVELRDRGGITARLPLEHFSLLQPQITVQVRKADMFNTTKKSEPVFQSFTFPLADFVAVSPELDVTNLDAIRFVFDRTKEGVVILDNLAFTCFPN